MLVMLHSERQPGAGPPEWCDLSAWRRGVNLSHGASSFVAPRRAQLTPQRQLGWAYGRSEWADLVWLWVLGLIHSVAAAHTQVSFVFINLVSRWFQHHNAVLPYPLHQSQLEGGYDVSDRVLPPAAHLIGCQAAAPRVEILPVLDALAPLDRGIESLDDVARSLRDGQSEGSRIP